MRYLVFQVVAFSSGVPESVAISNESAPVLEKYNALLSDGGGSFDRIEYWAKGIRRSKHTFINGRSASINVEESARVLIAANSGNKKEPVSEGIDEETTSLPADPVKGVSAPPEGAKPKEDTKEKEGDGSEIDASPAAIALAEANNIDLAKVIGTGTNGKITKVDVEKLL